MAHWPLLVQLRDLSQADSLSCTASTSTRPSSTRSTHLALVDGYARPRAAVDDVATAWAAVAAAQGPARSRRAWTSVSVRLGAIWSPSSWPRSRGWRRRPEEDDELSAARQVLASAERVQRLCDESYGALYESDQAVLSSLAGVRKRIGGARGHRARSSGRTSPRARGSSRSWRTWRGSCATMATGSTPLRSVCSRSRNGSHRWSD